MLCSQFVKEQHDSRELWVPPCNPFFSMNCKGKLLKDLGPLWGTWASTYERSLSGMQNMQEILAGCIWCTYKGTSNMHSKASHKQWKGGIPSIRQHGEHNKSAHLMHNLKNGKRPAKRGTTLEHIYRLSKKPLFEYHPIASIICFCTCRMTTNSGGATYAERAMIFRVE